MNLSSWLGWQRLRFLSWFNKRCTIILRLYDMTKIRWAWQWLLRCDSDCFDSSDNLNCQLQLWHDWISMYSGVLMRLMVLLTPIACYLIDMMIWWTEYGLDAWLLSQDMTNWWQQQFIEQTLMTHQCIEELWLLVDVHRCLSRDWDYDQQQRWWAKMMSNIDEQKRWAEINEQQWAVVQQSWCDEQRRWAALICQRFLVGYMNLL